MSLLDGKKYKYIHLLWVNEVKFNIWIVKMINEESNGFFPHEQCFITPHVEVYEALRQYSNVFLDINNMDMFRKYNDACTWFVSHGYPKNSNVLFLERKIKQKIVYRYWGGRRVLDTESGIPITKKIYIILLNYIYNILFKIKYSNLAMIGVANEVDVIDLRPLLPNATFMRMPYAKDKNTYNSVLIAKQSERINSEILNVMIGHRSDPAEKHIYYLELLKKYQNEKMHIFMPMSYYNEDYAKKVREYVESNKLENVTIIDKMMDYVEYAKFINSMDLALIDCNNSSALGNITLLLTFGKTIYLSRNGVIKKAFDLENVPHHCLDEIASMTWKDFKELLFIEDKVGENFKIHSFEYQIDRWRDVFSYLEQLENL